MIFTQWSSRLRRKFYFMLRSLRFIGNRKIHASRKIDCSSFSTVLEFRKTQTKKKIIFSSTWNCIVRTTFKPYTNASNQTLTMQLNPSTICFSRCQPSSTSDANNSSRIRIWLWIQLWWQPSTTNWLKLSYTRSTLVVIWTCYLVFHFDSINI